MGFQNSGTKTWSRDGKNFVSVYTHGPKYRKSVFVHPTWVKNTQPAKLKELSVAPGAVGHVSFTLQAPKEEGTFKETFWLAVENMAWMDGGEFTLQVNVAKPAPAPVVLSAPSAATSDASGLSAFLLLRSSKEITAAGGDTIEYTIGVKNTGAAPWSRREIRAPDIQIAALIAAARTRDSSWLSSTKLVAKTDPVVAPGSLEFFTFKFRAPNEAGSHTVRYVMAVDDVVVPDFFIDIPVTVTSTSPDIIEAPFVDNAVRENVSELIEEPYIRIGVFTVDDETDHQVVVSCNAQWELQDGAGVKLGEFNAGARASAFYKNGQYWYNLGSGLVATDSWIRFVPTTHGAICTVENFDRRITRKMRFADNQFRNILELRHNDHKDRTWLINELPIEDYLAGLAETSNSSHPEYQKALVTAARTFAYYHVDRNSKRAKEFFTISAYADDQVYNGYEHEARSPTIAKAVRDTRGSIVTYNGEYALTPYYSRSDGRTRAWSEVWGGDVAWLKSVPAACDARKGRQLWGHGVGMSATEALCMAEEEGKTWDQILKYFYTGVELTRKWK